MLTTAFYNITDPTPPPTFLHANSQHLFFNPLHVIMFRQIKFRQMCLDRSSEAKGFTWLNHAKLYIIRVTLKEWLEFLYFSN